MDEAAKNQEQKARRFVTFCVRRLHKNQADGQIATEMGFRSAEVLYKQLESDGSPVCGVCGLLYPEPDHREGHKSKRRKRQPDVGSGRRVRLPDTSSASKLFRTALEEFELYISLAEAEESWLEGNTEQGKFKGKHFITHSVERDALEVARREEFTEEGWREICEEHGGDPDRDQVVLSRGEASPGGVTRTPSMFLVALVAAHALANRPIVPLVQALHYAPDSVAWDQLVDNVDELRKVAGHLATRVRGGTVESGRGVEEISPEEHFLAWCIRTLDKEGLPSDEAVLVRLRKTFPSVTGELTVGDVDRIRRERLEPPE